MCCKPGIELILRPNKENYSGFVLTFLGSFQFSVVSAVVLCATYCGSREQNTSFLPPRLLMEHVFIKRYLSWISKRILSRRPDWGSHSGHDEQCVEVLLAMRGYDIEQQVFWQGWAQSLALSGHCWMRASTIWIGPWRDFYVVFWISSYKQRQT